MNLTIYIRYCEMYTVQILEHNSEHEQCKEF